MSDGIPVESVNNQLGNHENVLMQDDLVGVVTEHDFETLLHISKVLDSYGLEVKDTMWVDNGQEFYLQSS